MKAQFKVKMDIIDGLDHVQAKIDFMANACIGLANTEETIGEEASFGMQLVFDDIRNQLAAIYKALYENIDKDEEITLGEIINVE
jgi:division protein CdvB (Snf7/Vps24/ESCRT-III family)